MRLNIRQIEAFRFVFQAGNMTVAGDLMGITQPAISRLIKDLEAEIGFRLFDRTRGGLTPTTEAIAFFREVDRSFQGLDRLARTAKEIQNRRTGDLRIAATVATSFYLLPNVIQQFHLAWPDVKISLHACASPEVRELVALQQYDLGIAVVPSEAAGVNIIDLPALPTVCVLPTDHRLVAKEVIRPEDLDGEPLLTISDYSITHQRVLRCLEDAKIDLNIVLESTYSAPICDLVAQGVGISILEPVTAMAYAGPNIVLRPFEPEIAVELKLIHPGNRPLSEPAQDLTDIIQAKFLTFQTPVKSV